MRCQSSLLALIRNKPYFWKRFRGGAKDRLRGTRASSCCCQFLQWLFPVLRFKVCKSQATPRLRCPLVKAVPDPDDFFLRALRNNAVICVFGKLDLPNIRASLNAPCPHCGHSITPEERTHVDTETPRMPAPRQSQVCRRIKRTILRFR